MTSAFARAAAAVDAGQPLQEVVQAFVAGMTLEQRLWCLDGDAPTWDGLRFLYQDGYHQAPFIGARIDELGLPGIAFADGPRGAVVGNATAFPVSMARGATWDPELEQRVGEAVGRELRAVGANLTGAVCVNVLRHPAWGRAQETYGEDPFHVGELGAAFTRGLQQHVMACVKHFACNSMENARFSVDIEVDDVALHEVYLPHFKRIIDEGVASVMSAYNSVNGDWCGESRALLTDVLRDEWGFEGFVISDWIFGLRDAARSLHGGLDIEMPYRMVRAQHLGAALERGDASWADVDRSVERVVSTLLRFRHLLGPVGETRDEVLGNPSHRALAREVAGRSVVLLRNEAVGGLPALPFGPEVRRLAVVGRLAAAVNLGDGGSSDVWDLDCHSVLDGLESVADVVHDDGSDVARAATVAAGADAVVVVVGYTADDEGEYIGETDPSLGQLLPPSDEPDVADAYQAWLSELPSTDKPARLRGRARGFSIGGDRSSLRLPAADVELIRAVAAATARTVVAIQAGSAVVMSEWVDAVPAVVQSWYGGSRAGEGLADVLFGAVNPSARLPFSVPVDELHLPAFDRDATSFRYDQWHGWWHLARTGVAPAFPFGFGLSYTSFEVGEMRVELEQHSLSVTGVVRNTGTRDGADVVQVYVELPGDRPPRLAGFSRVEVAAGGVEPFEIRVALDRLATRDPDQRRWHAPAGAHRVVVARHVGDPAAVALELDLGE